jgi:hypothetical protein
MDVTRGNETENQAGGHSSVGRASASQAEGKNLQTSKDLNSLEIPITDLFNADSTKFLQETDPEINMDHDEAAAYVAQKLSHELNRNADSTVRLVINGCIPDVIVRLESGKYLVVEIGSTTAEKIIRYLKAPEVEEIRWYTRTGLEAGSWKRRDEGNNLPLHTIRKMKAAIRSEKYKAITMKKQQHDALKHEAERLNLEVNLLGQEHKRILISCPYCHERRQIKNAELTN